ncbi:hypothetical protein [Mycobacterium nebraskense]|uniref:Membrane glycine and proline rich protein n=1 Tax=Mycobacterium nebraskense TaxID=244292 RepID=A0A1X2A004_9MYCO|nr:hypothetical protein [Mycobacterium nebraskense]KKC01921.1 glycine and proline rich membrane protein [Mycobacterium nebraskense]MBI2693491.1 hypothetical protein [Mycobacterium nebraskense]MCV7117405.1 hypothetical protein [Mycobacterium nebraskense]ORW33614.1 hypothetical protein AWC17_24740 [Mycobacterium nebraskense]
MTAPPGGPYDQGPYGNPYGQEPQWGGQPQGGQYPYPPTGPYQYSPQPYPQAGQQFPPGPYPPGPYPPGPPPGGPSSKLPWLIIGGLVILAVIALVATLMVMRGGSHSKPSTAAPSSTTTTASQPRGSQTATDCTPNVSGGEMPRTDSITAGKLSFPAAAVPPNWTVFSDDQGPNLIGAVGVAQDVPGANQWMMTAEVGVTNFVASMDVTAQASKLLQCIVNGPGYANASPTLGPTKTSSITVDGTKAARVDADVTIADPTRNVKGDSVTVIAVDTKPVTVFIGSTPIGDAASADIIGRIIAALKVNKS